VVEGKRAVNFGGGWSRVETRFMRDCAIAFTVIKWLQSRSGTCRAQRDRTQAAYSTSMYPLHTNTSLTSPGAEMCNKKKSIKENGQKKNRLQKRGLR
jgi:hypothetical protein